MRRAIREHLRDFIAIGALFVVGLVVTGYVLSQQQQPYPSWIPFLGDERFELKAELSRPPRRSPRARARRSTSPASRRATSPRSSSIDGSAVVTMLVEEQYAPILRSDATVLLRPRTGLQDMTLELDPGRKGEPLEEGATIPLAQTEPNVNPDQILASLDGDTRDYLKLLIQGGAEGLGGRGKELSAGLRRFEPLGRYLAQIGNALVERRRNIARVITSFRDAQRGARRRRHAAREWVSAQNAALGAFANQEAIDPRDPARAAAGARGDARGARERRRRSRTSSARRPRR